MKKAAGIGIDVGGTKTCCVVVDRRCRVLDSVKFKTKPTEGRKAFTRNLVEAVTSLQRAALRSGHRVVATGVGCAGSVDHDKVRIKIAPNILSLEDYPIGKYLTEVLKTEVVIGNDVHMGLYGEYRLGAAAGASNVLGAFFGTGVGGAAIINGQVYHGASGYGGQIGSILAQPVGGPKAALSHGILDRIASKAAIAGEALVMAVKAWAPYLHTQVGTDLSKVTWGVIREAIEKGDTRIDEMLRARMRVVGIALSSLVNFLNPEILVLGGGLMEEMPKLVVSEIEAGLREYLMPEVSEALKVRAARLKGQAVALGAVSAALERWEEHSKARGSH